MAQVFPSLIKEYCFRALLLLPCEIWFQTHQTAWPYRGTKAPMQTPLLGWSKKNGKKG